MSNFESILKDLSTNEIIFGAPLLSDKSKEVVFRPMTVKDQKLLLINADTEEYSNQVKALLQLLKNCIIKSHIKAEEMFIPDFIWLILNLRMKSIGESVDISGTCQKCYKRTADININFEKNIILNYLSDIKNNTISINKNLKLFLNFPKVKHIINKKKDSTQFDILADEIDYVEFNEEVIELKDDEKVKLLETLDSKFIKKFNKFEESNPFGIELKFEFECKECKHHNEVVIKENILDFF